MASGSNGITGKTWITEALERYDRAHQSAQRGTTTAQRPQAQQPSAPLKASRVRPTPPPKPTRPAPTPPSKDTRAAALAGVAAALKEDSHVGELPEKPTSVPAEELSTATEIAGTGVNPANVENALALVPQIMKDLEGTSEASKGQFAQKMANDILTARHTLQGLGGVAPRDSEGEKAITRLKGMYINTPRKGQTVFVKPEVRSTINGTNDKTFINSLLRRYFPQVAATHRAAQVPAPTAAATTDPVDSRETFLSGVTDAIEIGFDLELAAIRADMQDDQNAEAMLNALNTANDQSKTEGERREAKKTVMSLITNSKVFKPEARDEIESQIPVKTNGKRNVSDLLNALISRYEAS